MNQNQRDALVDCLTTMFGPVSEALIEDAIPLLEWVELTGGQTLFDEGDPPDSVYFVLSGRLRSYVMRDGERRVAGEFIRGETVGERSVLTGEPRSESVSAVRDSVLARASATSFQELWRRHPEFSMAMARTAIERIRRSTERPRGDHPATICLVPISDGLDLMSFGAGLADALRRWGSVTLQTRDSVTERFDEGAANARPSAGQYHQLSDWLDEIERQNDFMVMLADDGETEWTRRCIRHADEVLFVARPDATMRIHPVEERLCMGERSITAARQTLILLHPRWRRHPSGTAEWIDRRPIDRHFHVRPELPQDLARLARIVSGNATGLVLSGGGAKGFAHLGVLRALEEEGIDVDFVGGTSIGAVMAAWSSFALPAEELIELARTAFSGNPTGDYNLLPLVSLVSGRRLKKTIHDAVVAATGAEADILDSWRTLFCVASSFSGAREVVITRGRVDRALRASASIPVALPPVPLDGELLVDGGVFNNFPTDVMQAMGARRIIGVDLARRTTQRFEHNEVPGSWRLLFDRLRGRGGARYKVPSLGAMLVGTTLLCSESRREQARAAIDIYINPELSSIGLLDWKSFDATVELGYRETLEVLSGIDPEELAPYLDGDAREPGMRAKLSRNSSISLTSAAVAASSR